MYKRIVSLILSLHIIFLTFGSFSVYASDDPDIVYAQVDNISVITSESPMTISLDLRDVADDIQNAELFVILKSSKLGAYFEIQKDGSPVLKRSVNANERGLFADITQYVTAGEINKFILKPCLEDVILTSSEQAYVILKTNPVASVLASADFESHALDEVYTDFERAVEENIALSDNPDGEGKVMKVTLNNTDSLVSGAKRSEAVLHSVGGIGMHMWYTFDTYLPKDFVEDGMEIITQWHVYPDDHLGENWRSPVLGLKISGGYFALSSRWDKRPLTNDITDTDLAGADDNISLGRIITGEWINWIFEINWSTEDDGFIRVWRNGIAQLDRKGPNIYNDQNKLNLKQGFYKSSGYDETSLTDKREIYFDNLGIYYHSDLLKSILPKSKYIAALIEKCEKNQNGLNITASFENLMSSALDATVVYEIKDKISGEICLSASEKITLDGTLQLEKGFSDIPENYVLNVYISDADGNVISNVASTEPMYFYKLYDFEDFIDSNTQMPEYLSKNGYSSGTYDSMLGGKYINILSSGGKNGFSIMNAAGAELMSNRILLSAKVKIPEDTECYFFNFNEYSSTSSYGLTFTDDNVIMFGNLYLGRYENNKWHSVSLMLDIPKQTADVFLDGNRIADDLKWCALPYTNIHMYAQSMSLGVKTYTGVDDLLITDNPDFFMENTKDFGGIKVRTLSVTDLSGMTSIAGKGEKTVSLTVSNTAAEPRTAELIAAVYEEDCLQMVITSQVEVSAHSISADNAISVTLENDNQYIRAFVWDSLSGMKPIGK